MKSGWSIKAVVTKPDSLRGRGQTINTPKIKSLALEHNILVYQPEKLIDIKDNLKDLGVEFGVLVSYGKIIPQVILDIFSGGIVNIHPSLLPKYRGPSPIVAAILNGDSETGVTLMRLSAGMDEGPIYIQEKVNLNSTEDRLNLSESLSRLGSSMLTEHLPAITEGSLLPKEQDDTAASYTKLLIKEDGIINWSDPAAINERKVRAYLGYPKARAEVSGHKVVILKARIASSLSDGHLILPSGDGFLEIVELIAPSGKTMSGEAFKRGYA